MAKQFCIKLAKRQKSWHIEDMLNLKVDLEDLQLRLQSADGINEKIEILQSEEGIRDFCIMHP
ncbi:MAG: hypothetical protein KDK44_01990, partial [Chlamydiia bacterium]|nr:hypothetical protein [Chlamydiia bacterium]